MPMRLNEFGQDYIQPPKLTPEGMSFLKEKYLAQSPINHEQEELPKIKIKKRGSSQKVYDISNFQRTLANFQMTGTPMKLEVSKQKKFNKF